jgi:hypothetical protein
MTPDNWTHHFRNITQKTKQRWKIRADGDITRTQGIVHLGQQTLKMV